MMVCSHCLLHIESKSVMCTAEGNEHIEVVSADNHPGLGDIISVDY